MAHTLRPLDPGDSKALHAIYAPLVEGTAISFEWEAPDEATFYDRLKTIAERYPLCVAADDQGPTAFAYANRFRERRAYDWTVETTIYVAERARGQGVGRSAMEWVLAACRARGYRRAVAGIVLPNDGSRKLHLGLGFTQIGILPGAGFKFGRSWDLEFWHLDLLAAGPTGAP